MSFARGNGNAHRCMRINVLWMEITGVILLFSELELESSHLYPDFCVSNTHTYTQTLKYRRRYGSYFLL